MIPARYTQDHPDKRVLPLEFVGDTQMLLVGASMGSGKTHQVHNYLATHPDLKRVLIVTADTQQAEATHNALADLQWDDGSRGVTCSVRCLDEPMEQKTYCLGRFDKLVVNYTSLHQLIVGVGITVYDLVIIDDIRNVLSEAQACEEFSRELKLDHDILHSLIASRQSICLGSNIEMDEAVWGWVSETVPEGSIQYHRYTHVAHHRTVIRVEPMHWELMLRESMKTDKRVAIIGRSKATMQNLSGLWDFLTCNVLEFDADSDPEQMQSIDKNLDGVDVLAFSGKTGTAIDIQTTFDTLYVNCENENGPTPRDMLQMIGRFRHITSGEVVCCLPDITAGTQALTYAGECGVVNRAEDVGVLLQSQVGNGRTISIHDGVLTTMLHPLVLLTAHGRVERKSCFSLGFIQQVYGNGWAFGVCRLSRGGVVL